MLDPSKKKPVATDEETPSFDQHNPMSSQKGKGKATDEEMASWDQADTKSAHKGQHKLVSLPADAEKANAELRSAIQSAVLDEIDDALHTTSDDSNIRPFFAYLAVQTADEDTKVFSSPSTTQAANLRRPAGNSLDHQVTACISASDHSYIQINHFATAMGVFDSAIGHTRIYSPDIQDFEIKCLTDKTVILDHLQKFCKGLKIPPLKVYSITITATRASHNVSWLGMMSLEKEDKANRIAKPQLLQLKESLSQDKPIRVELLALPNVLGDKDHARRLRVLERGMTKVINAEETGSPLEVYFTDQQSKVQRTLQLSTAPSILSGETHDIGTLPAHTRYVSQDQQMVYQLMGAKYEMQYRELKANQPAEMRFKAAFIPCEYVEDDMRCMAIVLPEGRGHQLPQNGDSCLMKVPTRVMVTEGVIMTIASGIDTLVSKSHTKDAPGEFVIEHTKQFFTSTLTEAEATSLEQMEDEYRIPYLARLQRFCKDRTDKLNLEPFKPRQIGNVPDHDETQEDDHSEQGSGSAHDDALAAEDGNLPLTGSHPAPEAVIEDRGCSATRLDIPALQLVHDMQVYLVKQSRFMKENGLEFDYSAPPENEPFQNYLQRITARRNLKTSWVTRVESDKAVKAEFLAMNSLRYPPGTTNFIDPRSLEAYQYLLRFDRTGTSAVNLFEIFDGLAKVKAHKASNWLLETIDKMDPAKKACFASLKDVPAGVKFIPGVAASGKSHFLIMVILSILFGSSEDVEPQEAKAGTSKILYCVNNNAAVDTFARLATSTISKLGVNVPIVRMYAFEGETARMTRPKHEEQFDREAAETSLDAVTETDMFLAQYQITKATIDIHAAKKSQTEQKSKCQDMSLQEYAVKWLNEHPEWNPEFSQLLSNFKQGVELTQVDTIRLQSGTKALYRDCLSEFRGLICTTPIAAANFQFRSYYRPDIVVVDEGGRLRELELMALVAWYPGPFIIVGDIEQLAPSLELDVSAKNDVQSGNPFARQHLLSPLARAVNAGATDSYLLYNHRALGNLVKLPSQLIYVTP